MPETIAPLGPDKLPASLQERLKDIRPKGRYYKLANRTALPSEFWETLFEAALVCPTIIDLAAFYYVDPETFRKWREAHPKIDVIIAQAKQADIAEVLLAMREKAVDNKDSSAARLYISAVRPDLTQPDTQVNIDNRRTTVKVLPTPKAEGEWTPPVINGQATEVASQPLPDSEAKAIPLRISKEAHPAPTATSRQSGGLVRK